MSIVLVSVLMRLVVFMGICVTEHMMASLRLGPMADNWWQASTYPPMGIVPCDGVTVTVVPGGVPFCYLPLFSMHVICGYHPLLERDNNIPGSFRETLLESTMILTFLMVSSSIPLVWSVIDVGTRAQAATVEERRRRGTGWDYNLCPHHRSFW